MFYLVFVMVLCILVGGALFFSLSTIALRIFSRVKLQEAFKAISREELADDLVKNSEKLALTCSFYRLLLNMITLLLLLAVFAKVSEHNLTFVDYILTFAIAMVVFLVFTLAIPHAWAKYSGERILSRTYKLLVFFAGLASPILYILQLYDRLIRRLAGVVEITPAEQQEEKQEEFLTELEMEGVVDQEEQEMIENVLELSDTAADEIMTPRTDIVAVEASADLETVLGTIDSAGHSRLPVYEENIDNIIGLIYAKDLLSEIGNNPADFKLRDKIRDAYFVPETKPLRVLLHEFQNRKLHIAVLLDEYGGTAGIVTIEDILEELVGEITDEYEDALPEQIKEIDADTIEVDARTYIDQVNDQFELDLPEDEDYDTIGGFVFSHLGYIPKTAEIFEYKRLKFTIRSAEARRIKRIRIQKVVEKNAD